MIVEQVKQTRHQAATLLAEIITDIASDSPAEGFLVRIVQESFRTEVESYDKALKWMGLEVLGVLSSVNNFEHYVYSETIATVQQLLSKKYSAILIDMYEVDSILADAWKRDPLAIKLEPTTRQKVDQSLKEIVVTSDESKREIARDYYEEIEQLRQSGRSLNLLQRSETEMFIDSLNYLINFIHKYDQMFLNINNP